MKSYPSKAKSREPSQPFEVVKQGSISIPIYAHTNVIPQRDLQTRAILYEPSPDGKRKALIKYQSVIYTVASYQGKKRVRQKFSDLAKARREAELIAIKLANGETEALKLTGGDRADYVRARQKLREWKPGVDLNLAITDYVAVMRRLPEHVSLSEVVESYLKRHPIGLRHSFISYRLAVIKDLGQVSLEAGNLPGIVFKHYRQLVRESEAKAWFSIMPPNLAENVVPLKMAANA